MRAGIIRINKTTPKVDSIARCKYVTKIQTTELGSC